MNRFEAMVIGLAVQEHEGCSFSIDLYSGRGMYGNATWSFNSELKPLDVMSMTAGYLVNKSCKDLAQELIENRHMFTNCLEVDEEELNESMLILADTLDSELEFVKGMSSDSLGRGYVLY